MPDVMMEQGGAAGVPIAVPWSCSKKVSSKVKILFFMMILSIDRNISIGNL